MSEPAASAELRVARMPGAAVLDRLARGALFRRLARLAEGEIVWREAGEPVQRFGRPGAAAIAAEVTVHSPAAYRAIAFGGSIGAADAYVEGLWSANDLVALIRILARQRELHAGLDCGWGWVASRLGRLAHAARGNSRAGSSRNITAHYDLGNEFFAQWLDPSMTYSCGLFEHPEATLEEASVAKIDLACRKLELESGCELLEIGTGWGALAVHAARHYGCRVTTTTISRAQHDYAAERIAASGVADRITLLEADYRELPQLRKRFDRLVSIEMIEAVGERYLGRYLATVSELLVEDGRALIQAITIPDRLYADYRRGADFIQRRIFPGSFLPSLADLLGRVGRATDMSLIDLDELTPHYATTLRHWRERLLARREAIRLLGASEEFLRLWEFYFAYCEGAFEERVIGNFQLVLAKPGSRHRPVRSRPGALAGAASASMGVR